MRLSFQIILFWMGPEKLANLVVDEMLRANKLTQLEGPRNVGESGDLGEILPRLLMK